MSSTFQVRKLYYGEETTYGQPATVNEVFGLARSFSAGPELVAEYIRVGDRIYHSRLPIGLNFSPRIEFYPLTGKFLKYVFGKVTNTGSSPPYTHTLEIGTSLKSITVECAVIGTSGVAERAVGVLVDSMEFSVDADGVATVTLDCRARQVSKVSPYTDPNISIPNKAPFRFNDMTFSVGGTTYAYVTSASITVNNNLEERPRSGDYVSGFTLTGAEYEAELELLFEDFTFFDSMISKSVVDAEIRFQRAANDYIKFTLDDCLVEWEGEVPFEGDVLTQTVRLRPKNIIVEVKDDIAVY